jgi:VIT1/CCC1 family predicted Fe2+/Mn2+ transporter
MQPEDGDVFLCIENGTVSALLPSCRTKVVSPADVMYNGTAHPIKEAVMKEYPETVLASLRLMQKGEITEYHIYRNIAKRMKNADNRKILETIAEEEKAHYEIWTRHLETPAKPNRLKVFWYTLLANVLGYTFALKLMENGEGRAQIAYDEIAKHIPDAAAIAKEEDVHENELIDMLDEERLNYVGSMVLGLNDALVELTGALAGLTLALSSNPRLISLSGLVTGIAASFSMAASEYLSSKADNRPDALKSSLYTGAAYIVTVTILILPYLLLGNPFAALGVMLTSVVVIIFAFNFYISVAKGLNFKQRFFSMAAISLGVAAFSFGVGYIVKLFLGVDI